MAQDILFKTDSFVFSYRVGGILIYNDKILLQKPKNDDYSIIGGHISCMETSTETLKREYQEELHAEIEVNHLLAVGEVFFTWGNKPCHQVCFYNKVYLCEPSTIPMDGIFQGYDELDNKKIDLDFCWIPLSELRNGLKVYPLEIIPFILKDSKETAHFISKQV